VLVGAATFGERREQGVAFVVDLTERKRAEQEALQSERRYQEVYLELAHANRVATMGQLSASIAHEINQPITGVVINAHTGLRWLDAEPPNIAGVREVLGRIVRDANRSAEVIARTRNLIKKAPPRSDPLDINEALQEVTALTRAEAIKQGVGVRLQLTKDLPVVRGDRVQLQQVMLNLMINGIEAMADAGCEGRELLISADLTTPAGVLVAVQDTGPGVKPEDAERIFNAFYSTKPEGLGVGLSICRAIIESHGGKLWVAPGSPRGSVFQFTLPANTDVDE
jgi:C4-dicarboxylate-specific signal transduction histidine kinase